ncbi:SMI1/KNR4 family protein [Streptomyces sp. AP-93]|uniref:SMI1/KNR4 family protein n=1 Tax=Streptomyces sp. AP-93 TaxID=2929048 RepID=UPI001FAF5211|nr:SMI1/KNR4 family protein [Streptomyces sp. AP-93]MCJ0870725.1 SMI1/KNR4 family protein [Streptomyces sp. AP-93]
MIGRLLIGGLPARRRTRSRAPGWPTAPPPPDHPPLTGAEVAEAERELGIRFPPAYRSYLLDVSAGGLLHRLERGPAGWWWAGNPDTRRDLLPAPFPHPDSYVEADAALWDRFPREGDFPDEAACRTARQAWAEAEADGFEDRKTAGSVVLQDNGCGFSTLLALTGPLAGTVWWDGRATCGLIVPLSPDHPGGAPPLSFGQWRELGLRDLSHLLPPDWGRPAQL